MEQGLCLIETNLRAVREKVEKSNEIQLNDYVTKLIAKLMRETGKQHYQTESITLVNALYKLFLGTSKPIVPQKELLEIAEKIESSSVVKAYLDIAREN